MVLFKNLLPRYDIPVSNKYELINNSINDFHYVLYYLTINSCKIIIRRLDKEDGWNGDLKIKIFNSDNSNYEIISIGKNYKNCKMLNIYTHKIEIIQIKYKPQHIPKIIVQTTANKNIENILFSNSIYSFIELNPEYEYRIYNDKECRDFIKKNFDRHILIAYDILVPGAFKADLFRYCVIYINGGCYFDCKQILRKPLRDIINDNDYLLLCNDLVEGYFNAIILSEKNNNHLLKAINTCVNRIYNYNNLYKTSNNKNAKTLSILSLTGPYFLYETLKNDINKNEVLKFSHKDKKFSHGYLNLHIDMNGQYIITKSALGYNYNGNEAYAVLWRKNEVVYNNILFLYNYIFYVYPNNSNDSYMFYIIDEKSFIIERDGGENGWGNNLKIKIINDDNNEELKLNIGDSKNKYKLYNIDYNFFNVNNIVKSFNYSDEHSDTFDVKIISDSIKNKLIVKRLDKDIGWGQNLNLNIILIDDKILNINVGNSNNNIKVMDI
jgi:mannosyltransferase OCH1-like enzyme